MARVSWFGRNPTDPAPLLESRFGKLELRVLEAMWARGTPASVRDLQPAFPHAAYTTLMTTLDRLFRKGVVDRVKRGRAFVYSSRYTRESLRSGVAAATLQRLLSEEADAVRPLLSCLVETVGRRDRELLGELLELVRQKQKEQEGT
jgi:predicted transcriptional regulator